MTEVVKRIINELSGRGGFNGWWDDIDSDTQEEIIVAIDTIISAGREKENEKLAFLEALRQCGVDNWDGYGEAWDLVEEWKEKNEDD